ncbi:MAG: phosphoenolpyruvate synthase [Gammaproteobacteria bacterium]
MKYIRQFNEISINDISLAGGKNASLGEMYQALTPKGIRIPNGFAITADAYRHFINHNQLEGKIDDVLLNLDTSDIDCLTSSGAQIRGWITHAALPDDLAAEIAESYQLLEQEYGPLADVAVRSSATAEDLPSASFAGQQESYLNISGKNNLLVACRRVFASLFTDRAISYRADKGFHHQDVALSIGVQKMIRADLGVSGVMFTIDTETGIRNVVTINAAYGLGENIVQGTVNPDEFYVFKKKLNKNFRPIIGRHLGNKAIKMIYTNDAMAGLSTTNVPVSLEERQRFSLSDDEILSLTSYGIMIEDHYSKLAGHPRPMDIEWAKDGINNKLYILQARPETVHSTNHALSQKVYSLATKGKILAQGKSVGCKIAAGRAKVILEASQMHDLLPGEVLVTDITDPDWEPVMKIASAIVTNRGGRTCHAAIVARELGIPAVIGCGDAIQSITSGKEITVSCAEGDTGTIYEGILDYKIDKEEISIIERPKTHMMLNIADSDRAFEYARLPNDGVGLARLEFIINNKIRVHPNAVLNFSALDKATQKMIDDLSLGYSSHREFYIQKLAEGIGTISAAFYPKSVLIRLSDFKSNEYSALIGGRQFEPVEENPMIGFRGAGRYLSENFKGAFELECEAIRHARQIMGLDNIAIIIPFVRTVTECKDIIGLLDKQGLSRSEDLRIYMMCEIPSNALLANEFLEYVDGFSIGSNDLTQLTLGIDRDSSMVRTFDERDKAVKSLMEMAINACKKQNKYVGICGQAPSDYPEINRWLIEHQIDSISLNPDSLLKATRDALEIEKQLNHKKRPH